MNSALHKPLAPSKSTVQNPAQSWQQPPFTYINQLSQKHIPYRARLNEIRQAFARDGMSYSFSTLTQQNKSGESAHTTRVHLTLPRSLTASGQSETIACKMSGAHTTVVDAKDEAASYAIQEIIERMSVKQAGPSFSYKAPELRVAYPRVSDEEFDSDSDDAFDNMPVLHTQSVQNIEVAPCSVNNKPPLVGSQTPTLRVGRVLLPCSSLQSQQQCSSAVGVASSAASASLSSDKQSHCVMFPSHQAARPPLDTKVANTIARLQKAADLLAAPGAGGISKQDRALLCKELDVLNIRLTQALPQL